MGALDGRVAVVTGAGRGLGREHALLLAAEGAQVVVNDLDDESDPTPAQQTVDQIVESGGAAVVNTDNVASWHGAARLIDQAVDTFGDLHVLVNNAGILRDRTVANMTEQEWDAVVSVHLKGHFATAHHAARYWRAAAKEAAPSDRAMVHTTSTSGLFANPGQANYDAAKSAIATLSQVCAQELARYGVRSNAIAPAARTRMTLSTPGSAETIAAPDAPDAFDAWHPGNVSPMVAYLARADCPFTGETFLVFGNVVQRVQSWLLAESVQREGRWTVADLAAAAPGLQATVPVEAGFWGYPTFARAATN